MDCENKIMSQVINWVVALAHEAKPIIDRFSLHRVNGNGVLFPIYESADRTNRVIVSGIGKTFSASAVAVLAERAKEDSSDLGGWINFGIAGSGLRDFGQVFLASRVTDRGSERSWYPPAVWPRRADLRRREVITVDRPEMDGIDGDSLIEMEASGFYSLATKVATSELCQVIKVVSDDPDHSVREIRKEGVVSLCEAALDQMDPWLEVFRGLIAEEELRHLPPAGFQEWQNCARFSVTQVHQLKRLLQQGNALGGADGAFLIPPFNEKLSSRDCLTRLRNSLSELRGKLSES